METAPSPGAYRRGPGCSSRRPPRRRRTGWAERPASPALAAPRHASCRIPPVAARRALPGVRTIAVLGARDVIGAAETSAHPFDLHENPWAELRFADADPLSLHIGQGHLGEPAAGELIRLGLVEHGHGHGGAARPRKGPAGRGRA